MSGTQEMLSIVKVHFLNFIWGVSINVSDQENRRMLWVGDEGSCKWIGSPYEFFFCFETWTAKAGHPPASVSWVYKLSLLHPAWTEALPGMDMWDRPWKKWRLLDHKWGMIEGFTEMEKEKFWMTDYLLSSSFWMLQQKYYPKPVWWFSQ